MRRIRPRREAGRRQDERYGNRSSCFNAIIPIPEVSEGSSGNTKRDWYCWRSETEWMQVHSRDNWLKTLMPIINMSSHCYRSMPRLYVPTWQEQNRSTFVVLSTVDSSSVTTHCVALCAWGQIVHLNVLRQAALSNSRSLASVPMREITI